MKLAHYTIPTLTEFVIILLLTYSIPRVISACNVHNCIPFTFTRFEIMPQGLRSKLLKGKATINDFTHSIKAKKKKMFAAMNIKK